MWSPAKLWKGTRNMVKKAKVYGKQKTNEFVTAFHKLHVSSPSGEGSYIHIPDPPSNPPDNKTHRVPTDEHDAPDIEGVGNKIGSTNRAISGPHGLRITSRSVEGAKNATHEPKGKRAAAKRRSLLDPVDEVSALALRKGKGREKRKAKGTAYDPNDEITALTSLDAVADEIQDIDNMFRTWAEDFSITKIAQGSFGSVLRIQMKSNPSAFVVCKLMPIMPKEGTEPGALLQTYIKDAAAEVRVLDRMGPSPGFVQFRSAQVLRGSLPDFLMSIFHSFDEEHPEDTTPDDYGTSQLWLLIEMTDAGTDLATLLKDGFPDGTYLNKSKKHERLNLYQTWDIFWSVAEALAHGEEHAEFEHRDLHPGNICIKRNAEGSDAVNYIQTPRYTDLEVTLIDYTLSRVTLDNGEKIYNSMDDDELFKGKGRTAVDRQQYSTYRAMRDVVTSNIGLSSAAKADNPWSLHLPKTNLLWLYHILFVLFKETDPWTGDHALADTLAWIQTKLHPVMIKDCVYKGAKELVDAYKAGAFGAQ